MDRDHPLLESIKGIKIIDVDTHLTEPGDPWTSRAPAKYRDLVPRVEFRKNSELQDVIGWRPDRGEGDDCHTPVWMVDKDIALGFAGGASVINKSKQKVRGADFVHWPLTEVSPAASLVEPRLVLMDEVGIWGQIMYPNAVGFGAQAMAGIQDPTLRLLILQIWNEEHYTQARRAQLQTFRQPRGDVTMMADAIIAAGDAAHPPRRLVLGSDSHAASVAALRARLEEVESQAATAAMTDAAQADSHQ